MEQKSNRVLQEDGIIMMPECSVYAMHSGLLQKSACFYGAKIFSEPEIRDYLDDLQANKLVLLQIVGLYSLAKGGRSQRCCDLPPNKTSRARKLDPARGWTTDAGGGFSQKALTDIKYRTRKKRRGKRG